jgi:hypothetical protein
MREGDFAGDTRMLFDKTAQLSILNPRTLNLRYGGDKTLAAEHSGVLGDVDEGVAHR